MKRKMTLFALPGKCVGFGASGLAGAAAARPPKKPSCERSPVSARPVKPAPASQRNSRRVRRQNWRALMGQSSVQVDELVQVQDRQAKVRQRRVRPDALALLQALDQPHAAAD